MKASARSYHLRLIALRFGLILLTAAMLPHSGLAEATDSSAQQSETSVSAAASDTSAVDDIANKFVLKCSGCHTVGGGKLSGPDLLPTRVWPKPDLFAKIKTMENRVGPLADQDIHAFGDFLRDDRVEARIKIAQELAGKAVALKLAPASLDIGSELFDGRRALSAGGIACISCHQHGIRGGTLGPDLTEIHARLPKVAMVSAIQQSQYRVMSGTYQKHPITAQESVHLAEFLSTPVSGSQSASESSVTKLGYITAFFGFALIIAAYRKRSPGYKASLHRRHS